MALSIQGLQNVSVLSDATILVGGPGLTQPVENIALATSATRTNHLPAHEVLIASLQTLQQTAKLPLQEFICHLKTQKCSALLVRNDDFFIPLPAELVASCQQQGLPLLGLPYQTNNRDVFIGVTQALYAEKQQQLRYYQKIDRQFAGLTQSTSRQALLDTLATLIKNPVMLFQANENRIHPILQSVDLLTSIPEIQWSRRRPFNALADDSRETNWVVVAHPEFRLVAAPLFRTTTNSLYLGILETNQPLNSADFPTIESALSFLKFTISQQAVAKQNRQANTNELINDLLTGQLTPDERYQNTLRQLHLSEHISYRIFAIQALVHDKVVPTYFDNHPAETRHVIHFLKSHWPNFCYQIRQDSLLFICSDQDFSVNEIKSVFYQMTFPTNVIYQAAVGSAQLPNQLGRSAKQALETIQLIPSLTSSATLRSFDELGFYHCLSSLNSTQELYQLVPESLLALHQEHTELSHTLAVYLAHNLSVKHSAQALFIHPKTMSYRLSKIRQLLRTDLTDAEELFTFNVGLHILQFMQSSQN